MPTNPVPQTPRGLVRKSSEPSLPLKGHAASPPPDYSNSSEKKEVKKAALVVGHFGIGMEIVTGLVKNMDVAVAYASESNGDDDHVTRAVHGIRARPDVPTANKLKRIWFKPNVGTLGEVLKSVVTLALEELKVTKLDVVLIYDQVYASVFNELTEKNDIFNTKVSAFHSLYQATEPCRNDTNFRMVHVSTWKNSVTNATIETLIRVLGEDIQGTGTVNAIRYIPQTKQDKVIGGIYKDNVVSVVDDLLKSSSRLVNGQVIRYYQ